MLSELSSEKVCFLIVKLREFGVQVEENSGGGSDATDDKFVAVFNDDPNTSVRKEIVDFTEVMDADEQRELVALSLVGRGDFSKEEWHDAMETAGSRPEPTLAQFLMENPTISDDLEEGLSLFGMSCQDFETERL